MISVEIYVYVNLALPILSSFRRLTDCVIKTDSTLYVRVWLHYTCVEYDS